MTRIFNRPEVTFRPTAAFASAGTATSAVDISQVGPRMVAVVVPSGWTPGADLIMQGSASGLDWTTLCNTANVTLRLSGLSAISAPRAVPFAAEAMTIGMFNHLRLLSVSAGNDGLIQQTSGRTVTLLLGG